MSDYQPNIEHPEKAGRGITPEMMSALQTPISPTEFQTPKNVRLFLVVAAVFFVLTLVLGHFLPESRMGLLVLSSALSIIIVTGFGLFLLAEFNVREKKIKKVMGTDQTTGLYSSNLLMDQLEAVIEAGVSELVIIFLDLDELKKYNDKFGHRAGDELLRQSAEALVGSIGGDGVAFRYGGDEFVAILPGVSPENALKMARRVHQAFEDREISASIGVYSWRPGLSCDQLLEEADQAMYTAKRKGKGHVFVGGNRSLEIEGFSGGKIIC